MNITVEDLNPTRKKLEIQIPGETITEAEAKLVEEFKGQARLPGFRPGKAPANIVKKRYAKEIAQELNRKLATDAYEKALSESGLDIYTVVDMNADDFTPGIEANFEITVDVISEFELPEYKTLRTEIDPETVNDEEVEAAIERMREQRAEYNVVERPAEKGDYVRCSYTGKIGDEQIADLAPDARLYGTQRSTWEEAGSEESPGVRVVVDGLIGMSSGETKAVEMDFPGDFEVELLQGKHATYTIEVEEVRERSLPEMDKAFLESLQVESADDLKKQTRSSIENQKKQGNASKQREQIQQQLLEAVDFPIPQSAVEQQTQEILRDFMTRYLQQGVPQEEFEKRKDELYEGASKAAVDRVKVRFILGKIAEKEKITVENEDLSPVIMQEAIAKRMQPDQLVKELQKDRSRLQALQESVLMNKTLDFLVNSAESRVREAGAVETAAEKSGDAEATES